jgi:hypothetical protein
MARGGGSLWKMREDRSSFLYVHLLSSFQVQTRLDPMWALIAPRVQEGLSYLLDTGRYPGKTAAIRLSAGAVSFALYSFFGLTSVALI